MKIKTISEPTFLLIIKGLSLNDFEAENLKPYWVFTNSELDEIVERRPRTIADLLAIKGFGETKTAKYGAAILEIVNNKQNKKKSARSQSDGNKLTPLSGNVYAPLFVDFQYLKYYTFNRNSSKFL